MRAHKVAVLVIFAVQGVIVGTWAPRVPAVAEHVHAGTGELGLALLGASVGLIAAASVAGRLAAHFGARRLVLISALLSAAVVPNLALAPNTSLLGLALVALGASVGTLDVAMNIAAVTVVRLTERPLMPVFHAAYSFGALFGAAGAAFAAGHRIGPLPHFTTVAGLAALVAIIIAAYIPNERVLRHPAHQRKGPSLARRPVLWLLASVALCSAVAEGASADWSALFAVRERALTESAAAVIFAVFSISMAFARLAGERAERRFGPYRMLVGGAVVAGGGLLVAVLVPQGWASYVGFALAGAGLAYGFPVALSLGGAAGRRPDGSGGERELSFVTAIAYAGFLAGPPLVGGVAQLSNLAVAFGVVALVAAMIAPAALLAAAARHREESRARILDREISSASIGSSRARRQFGEEDG